MRLRDYVVLAVLVALCIPIFSCLAVGSWFFYRTAAALDEARYRQVQQEVFEDLHGR
jgi:hypothetical protein